MRNSEPPNERRTGEQLHDDRAQLDEKPLDEEAVSGVQCRLSEFVDETTVKTSGGENNG